MLSVPANMRLYFDDILKVDNGDKRKSPFYMYTSLEDEVKDDIPTWDKSIQGWRDCTSLISSKYSPLCYEGGVPANFDQPLVLMRYADFLLMYSELCYRTGDEAMAAHYLNVVRKRAGEAEFPLFDLASFKIDREMEFMFEGVNY